MSKYEEARFLRGDVGVDGRATEEKQDAAEVEKGRAREQFLRGKTWLGRELLTWLLYRSESGDPIIEFDGKPVTVLLSDRLVLRGIADDVLEMTVRGAMSPYSPLVREAIARGLLIHSARLIITHGDREYAVGLDAEHLSLKSAKLPELLTEEEDDRLQERLDLTEQLSAIVQALLEEYLRLRSTPRWARDVVPAMQAWARGEDEEPGPTTVARAS